ncbi:MAG: chromosomal replication initiator protein DnaA [Candidatus Nephthysia bennettiae]|uniref:Chromosomal replication initiator protein DnaA n=1 Tax=Candidatus Nephthysia bennettiae TaxID=3127016 RepID=A0A934K2H5_9BACT|nr:chromosomal replication initiator protein DnaA [Candidatus Dormibacteraeota bacterium]MBJ7612342.1 chromosomal replication initiator protein DnaA [Candidatus Dormibacteraeota bacterium]PZR85547.1 MAG: chromosomal replication initiator protein DnaA [Candidatus Dormibacteraeota bacterium]
MNQDQIWTAVQDELRFQLAKPSYETWLKNTTLLSADGSIYRVGVPSKLAKDWLEDRFAGLIQETLQAVTGNEVEVDFVVSSNGHRSALAGEDDLLAADDMPEPAPPVGQSELSEKFKFSSFVVGNNSRFAHAAAKAVADAPGETYNPLFLYGGVGLGKTHLMHAIGHDVRRRFPKKRVLYLTSEQFMNEVIASIQTARMSEFRVTYRTVDVLLIDDIQFLAGKDRTKEEFFHTFNALHEINKQIVISSDRPPKEIPTLEDRLRSRFEQGLLADIQSPDFETRLAILRSKLSANANLVSEAVLTFIAHKVQKNIRELEGALTRVLAFSAIHQRPVDEEEAARLLEDIIPAGNRRPLTIDRIQETVAEYYQVSVEDMKSKRRDKHIVFPRQVAMFVVREETPSSLPVIGQAFGGRDHTTALHSIEKIMNELKEDERLRYEVQSIRERLYAAR